MAVYTALFHISHDSVVTDSDVVVFVVVVVVVVVVFVVVVVVDVDLLSLLSFLQLQSFSLPNVTHSMSSKAFMFEFSLIFFPGIGD